MSHSRLNTLLLFATTYWLSGCAGVTVTALNADGTAAGGEAGVRYYRPQPYLLVAALPPTPPTTNSGGPVTVPPPQNLPQPRSQPPHPSPGQPGWIGPDLNQPGAGDTTPKDNSSKNDPSAAAPAPAPASSADVSFAASTAQYSIRLVYLPDYSHPLAITMHSGLFGTASFAPALQDGWMLTSLQANGDNKVAETLTAVGSILSATHGGGAGTSSATKGQSAPGGVETPPAFTDVVGQIIAESKVILRPGLYRFQYGSDGRLTGLCAVVFFSKDGATQAPTSCPDTSPPEAQHP